MAFGLRGGLAWLGMILSGLALGAFVLASWPDTSTRVVRLPYGEAMPKTPTERPSQVRATASVRTDPAAELVGVAGVAHPYPLELYYHELSASPLLDALISASALLQPQQSYDAH